MENPIHHRANMKEGIVPDSNRFHHSLAQWLFLGLVVVCLPVAFFLIIVPSLRNKRGIDLQEARGNARSFSLALLEFEQSYGCFPNDSTATEVLANTSSKLILGSSSSNDYFRQLMAAEITQSEAAFHAKIPNTRKPDGIFAGTKALERGECGFSYLLSGVHSPHPATPIVVTPLVPGKALFDYKAAKRNFSGKAVILQKDCTVQTLPIDKSGRVWINGKDLFDPTQPFWNGKPPVIKWPDL